MKKKLTKRLLPGRWLTIPLLVLCVLYNDVVQAQSGKIITGTVKDSVNGETLPGASVKAKSSGKSTSTDVEGKFRIEVQDTDEISISFIGFEDEVVKTGSQGNYEISLKPSNAQLNEVVVVGYGTQKKINLTGSVASVDAEDLQSRPITATSTGLQGLLPGVTVQSFSAQPGQTGATIRVRGVGTLGNSNAFVLIDGVEGDINLLNPDDIESVSVLKDAASSAIYGARGANGVILVTTKKGKADTQPAISYTNYFGFQAPTNVPDFLGGVDYIQLLSESQRNVGRPLTYIQ